MKFSISIILLVIAFVLTIWQNIVKKEKKFIFTSAIISFTLAIITIVLTVINENVQNPEIYTSNGDSVENNSVYIKTSGFLTVYYTMEPYNDPQKNGIKYIEEIPITTSMTISAKATFLGIFWSDLVSRDIIVNNDKIEVEEVKIPGSSIISIDASLLGGKYYTGNALDKSDFHVEGKTINGDNIVISDFEFYPEILEEGKNIIKIKYKDLEYDILQYVTTPALKSLNAEYIGTGVYIGKNISCSDFDVYGFFDNGEKEKVADFTMSQDTFNQAGKQTIIISVGDISTEAIVEVKPILLSVQIEDLDGTILADREIFLEGDSTNVLTRRYTDSQGYVNFEQNDLGKRYKVYKTSESYNDDNVIIPIGYLNITDDNIDFVKPQTVASIRIVDASGNVYKNSSIELININNYGHTFQSDSDGYINIGEFDLTGLELNVYTEIFIVRINDENSSYLESIGYTMLEGINSEVFYN